MMTLGGIPAKEDHKAPGKSLAEDDYRCHGKTLTGPPGKTLARATTRPLPRTPVGPPSGPRQFQPLPPFACSCRPNQLGRHMCGDKRIFMETHLSYLPPYMAPRAPLARARVDAKGIGDRQDWALPHPR